MKMEDELARQERIEGMIKQAFFAGFERQADLINHPVTEEEKPFVEEAERRVRRWTQEWFDDDEDPDDDGTTDPVEFARLEHELAALRLQLERNEISQEYYDTVKTPIQEAMYALLKD